MNALIRAFSGPNLAAVWQFEKNRLRKSAAGVDRQSGEDFATHHKREFRAIRESALIGRKPSGLLAIAKPKELGDHRIICIPTIADRFFQFALLAECRADLDARGLLNPVSYGLSRGAQRGVSDARAAAISLRTAHKWVLKADIQKFFDRIPRDSVREIAPRVLRKRSLLPAFLSFLNTEIESGYDADWKSIVAKAGIEVGKGVRQGMPLSPYYAGIILLPLDREIARRGFRAIRYVDDIVGFFDSEQECQEFADFLKDHLGKLGLDIGVVGAEKSKTRIFAPSDAVPFLGMELAWRTGKGFELRISKKCIEKIGSKFSSVASIDTLLARKVTLPEVGRLLKEMERGYAQAYEAARNHSELIAELETMRKAALITILEETFGENIHDYTAKQKRFLGIEDYLAQ